MLMTDPDCWDVIPALVRGAAGWPRQPRTAWFHIADAYLEVVSDHDALFQELEMVYGDCAVPPPPRDSPRIRCVASALPGVPLLSLSFDGPRVADPLETAKSTYRFVVDPCYVEIPGPLPGWRQLVDAGNRLLMTSDGRSALVDIEQAPPEFVCDCIVGVAQGAQQGVLFLHAASVGVAGVGALIIAPTRGGKSTTALTLASRGHAFLGDDVAAVRLATHEVLPFPKSAGVRDGPLARLLDERLRTCRGVLAPSRHGVPRTLVRVGELFPGSLSGPLPLHCAFLLEGICDRATITGYQPQLADAKRLQSVVTDSISAWGISPGRDLMNYLRVLDLLSSLRCHLVQRGSLEETAGLIEAAMEESCP